MMMWRNTSERYGLTAMFLHWVGAILVFGLIGVGLYMVDLQDGEYRWGIYDLRKSFGVLFFLLFVARILWRWTNVTPQLPDTVKSYERTMAHLAHLLIYAMMILMPISGYIDSSAGGYHLGFFSFFDIPTLVENDEALARTSVLVHRYIAYVLIVVLLLHIGAAIKHHLISRDNVLLRMLPLQLRK